MKNRFTPKLVAALLLSLCLGAITAFGLTRTVSPSTTTPVIEVYAPSSFYMWIEVRDTTTNQLVAAIDFAGSTDSTYAGTTFACGGDSYSGYAQWTPVLPATGSYEILAGCINGDPTAIYVDGN